MKKFILILASVLLLGSSLAAKQVIYLAGDSTCASVNGTQNTSYRGWGQIFPFFFDASQVKIVNKAKGGASTKTFFNEGLWDSIIDVLSPGDMVLIQFGHNDENPNKDERGTLPDEYYANLTRFVKEVKEASCQPVLITPILRRRYDSAGKAMRNGGGPWNHLQYSPRMKQVASEQNVPIIDGELISEEWLNTMSREKAKQYYVWFNPGDYPKVPSLAKGKQDDTHLNQKGAYEIASRFAKALIEVKPSLAKSYKAATYEDVEQALGPIITYTKKNNIAPADRVGTIQTKGNVEIYSYASEVPVSSKYSVTVDGNPITVLQTVEPDVAIFGAAKEVTVKVTCLEGAPATACVRPLAKGYEHTLKGNVISFKLKAGDRVSVEPDSSTVKPLFIFVNGPTAEEAKAAASDPNVTYYRGGKLHKPGEIFIDNGKTVYFEGGAMVEGYIQQLDSLSNVTIAGAGILDARPFGNDNHHNAMKLHKVNNLNVRDLTVFNSDWWTNIFVACDYGKYYNFHVVAVASSKTQGFENDSFNIVGCQHVDIKGCFCYAHDDAYCIKTSPNSINIPICRPSFDVHYEDCVSWNITSGNSFEIGYTVLADVYDVWYKDLYCIHSGGKASKFRRAGISIHNGGGGHVHDIHYENVYIEDPLEHHFSFNVFKTPYKSYEWFPGKISDVTVKNLYAYKAAPDGNQLKGLDEDHLTERVTIENYYVKGKKITTIEGLDLRAANMFTKDIVIK